MLDLKRRREDVRAFVAALEEWIIRTLGRFNVRGERREDRVGVWVVRPDRPPMPDGSPAEDKIAAIGIRLRRWVSFHGIAINVEPDLAHFSGIVPCGVVGPWRDQPRRSRAAGDDGRPRRRTEGGVRRGVRARPDEDAEFRQERQADDDARSDFWPCALAALLAWPRPTAQQATDTVAPEAAIGDRRAGSPSRRRARWSSPPIRLRPQAGLDVLREGGNAADALVAVQTVLGLVEPQSSGLGGGAFLVWYDADVRHGHHLRRPRDGARSGDAGPLPRRGRQAAGLLRGGGRRPLRRRAGRAPAARNGSRAIWQAAMGETVRSRRSISPKAASRFRRGCTRWSPTTSAGWTRSRRRAPISSMRRRAAGGGHRAAQSGLCGKPARRSPRAARTPSTRVRSPASIVAAVRGHPTNPGQPQPRRPRRTTRSRSGRPSARPIAGFRVCGMGPPSSGALTIGQILGMVEPFDLATLGPDDPESWRIIGDATPPRLRRPRALRRRQRFRQHSQGAARTRII